MATKQSHLFLFLVALFLVFALVLAGEQQQEENENRINGAAGKLDGLFGGNGGGFGQQRRPCIRCGFRGKYCCGFRCCSAEEYKQYIKAQGVPHN